MSKPITEHEGSKYLREIRSATSNYWIPEHDQLGIKIFVDVYAVLEAFQVICPARAQAIKKLLCAGIRGKGSELEDLTGAEAAISRAIELQKIREDQDKREG